MPESHFCAGIQLVRHALACPKCVTLETLGWFNLGASVVGDSLMREPEMARTQMARVLSSSIFCDSPTQQKLLRYLIEHMADGRGGDLKEYTIGAAVFRRGPDFDPRTDSIVRVQVGVLR